MGLAWRWLRLKDELPITRRPGLCSPSTSKLYRPHWWPARLRLALCSWPMSISMQSSCVRCIRCFDARVFSPLFTVGRVTYVLAKPACNFFRFCFRDGESRGVEVIWFASVHPGLWELFLIKTGYCSRNSGQPNQIFFCTLPLPIIVTLFLAFCSCSAAFNMLIS